MPRATSVYSVTSSPSSISRAASSGLAMRHQKGKLSDVQGSEVTVQRTVSPRLAETAAKYLKNASLAGDFTPNSTPPQPTRASVREGRAQTISYGSKTPLGELEDAFFMPQRAPKPISALAPLDYEELMSVFSTTASETITIKRGSLKRSSSTAPTKRSSSKRLSSKRSSPREGEESSPTFSATSTPTASPRKVRARANSMALSAPPEGIDGVEPDSPSKKSKRHSSKRSSEKRVRPPKESISTQDSTPSDFVSRVKSSHSTGDILSASLDGSKRSSKREGRESQSTEPKKSKTETPRKEKTSSSTSGGHEESGKEASSGGEHHHHHRSRRRSATIAEPPSLSAPFAGPIAPLTKSSPKKRVSKLKILTSSATDVSSLSSGDDNHSSNSSRSSTPKSHHRTASDQTRLASLEEYVEHGSRSPKRHTQTEETPDAPLSIRHSPVVHHRLEPLSFEEVDALAATVVTESAEIANGVRSRSHSSSSSD